MSDSASVDVRPVEFEATDGAELVGDLAVPAEPTAAAIVCHPHPQYGGNRHNNVVTALFDALPRCGVSALRFDFRATFDHGTGERLDAIGALDALDAELDEPFADLPRIALGYSFGAMIALGLADRRVSALVLVAPPLAMATELPIPDVPTLVLTPRHDQFSPPELSTPIVGGWSAAAPQVSIDHQAIESADHSLVGHAEAVASRTTDWLTALDI